MPVYFSLGHVQPFADMSKETLEPGVTVVRGDGVIVGLRLDDPRDVARIPEISQRLEIDEDRLWSKLRGDEDLLNTRRAATWGGGGA